MAYERLLPEKTVLEFKDLGMGRTSQRTMGWWSRPETLDLEIFDIPVIDSVIADYEQEIEKPDTMVIMLTGRIQKLSKSVEAILEAKKLKFDRHYYNTGGSTLDNKIRTIEYLLSKYPTITDIHLFDDRDEHIPTFEKFGEDLIKAKKLINFKITHVKK